MEITGGKANFGDKQGLQIPCTVKIDGEAKDIECLQRVLREKNEILIISCILIIFFFSLLLKISPEHVLTQHFAI